MLSALLCTLVLVSAAEESEADLLGVTSLLQAHVSLSSEAAHDAAGLLQAAADAAQLSEVVTQRNSAGIAHWTLGARVLLVLGIFAAVALVVVGILAPSAGEKEEAGGAPSVPETVAAKAKAEAATVPTRCRRAVLWGRVLTSASSLGEGYALCSISGALVMLKQEFALSGSQLAWIQGTTYLMMPLTMLIAGPLADEIGRVACVGISYILLVVGSLLMATAKAFLLLFLGRCVEALGMGLGIGAVTIYISEAAPKKQRGNFCGLEEVFLCLGMMLGQVVNRIFADADQGWRWTLGFASLTPCIMLVMIFLGCLEESPRYLRLKGKYAEAEKALRRLLHEEEALEVIADWDADNDDFGRSAPWSEVLCPPLGYKRSAMILGIAVMGFQHLSGVAVITLDMPMVLAEEMDSAQAFQWSIIILAFRTLASVYASCGLVDTMGRRPLLTLSLFGMTCALILLGVIYLAQGELLRWKIAGFVIFLVSYAIGVGPVPWSYLAEAFETPLRGKGVSVGLAISRLFAFAELTAIPGLSDHIGIGGCYMCLAVLNASCLVFSWLFVKETMGVSLEHMKECFAIGT